MPSNSLSKVILYQYYLGQIDIIVSAENKDGQNIVTFQIHDTGIGIPPNIQQSLFKLYSTFNNQNSNKHGVGLGLAISKKLVSLLGPDSDIQLQSAVDIGSKFQFKVYQHCPQQYNDSVFQDYRQKVPILRINSSPQIKFTDHSLKSHQPQPKKQLKVLIVDDTPFNIVALSTLFKKLHPQSQIDSAFNGIQALQQVKKEQYSLILMDVNMPEMDGYQATREIRNLQKRKVICECKILIVTAFGSPQDKINSVKHGADGHLDKPVTLEELKVNLDRLNMLSK